MRILKLSAGPALALAVLGLSPAGTSPAEAAAAGGMAAAVGLDRAAPVAEAVNYRYRRHYRNRPGFYFYFGTPRRHYGYRPNYGRHYGYYPYRRYYRSW